MLRSNALMLTLIATIGLWSCNNSAPSAYVAKTDSLIQMLNETKGTLEQLDLQKLSLMVDTINFDAKFIESQIGDTVDVDDAMTLDSYLLIRKSNKRIVTAAQDHKMKLLDAESQLEDLRHDISKGLLSADSATYFWKHEAKNAHQIVQNIENFNHIALRNDTAFQQLKPQIDQIIFDIKQRDGF